MITIKKVKPPTEKDLANKYQNLQQVNSFKPTKKSKRYYESPLNINHESLKYLERIKRTGALIWFAIGFENKTGCGYIICNLKREIQTKRKYPPKHLTNNQAEYEAIYYALLLMNKNSCLFSDSQLIVYQINGRNRCNDDMLKQYRNKCRDLIDEKNLQLHWIPKVKNLARQI